MSEPTNEERAAWAESAVNTFGQETYCGRTFAAELAHYAEAPDSDAYTMVMDLMANLMHLARKHGWSHEDLIDSAKMHFEIEVEEENEVDACDRCDNTDKDGSGICIDCGEAA